MAPGKDSKVVLGGQVYSAQHSHVPGLACLHALYKVGPRFSVDGCRGLT